MVYSMSPTEAPTSVRVEGIPFRRLGTDVMQAWEGMRHADSPYASPYFHPAFTAAVDSTGEGVTVYVVEDRDGIRAIWPLCRDRFALRPVGWPAADFQGPLSRGDFDTKQVLRAAGAPALLFDHLVESSPPSLTEAVRTWRPSPFMDIRGGLEGYGQRASKTGRSNMSQARRRARQAASRLGEMHFEPFSTSHTELDQVIELKRQQYALTGANDYFAPPGRRALLHTLLDVGETDFGGVLSTVRCGSTLVAAHFGIRAKGVLHWWFPVYNPDLGNLSPGWILLRELVSAAPEAGWNRIDLGRGEDEYKRRAMTGSEMVGQGFVTRSAAVHQLLVAGGRARALVKRSALAPQARRLLRRRP